MKKFFTKQTINNVMCWLIFGIILVSAPSLFHYAYRIIVGFQDDIMNYLPDLLLIVLAVSCNMINMLVNGEKCINYFFRWILGILMGFISIVCWFLFFIMRFNEDFKLNSNFIRIYSPYAFYISLFIIVINTVVGCIIEIYTAYKNNVKDLA